MERRDVLKKILQVSFGVTLGRFLPVFSGPAEGLASTGDADVGIVAGSTENAVKTAIEQLGGIHRFVSKGDRVVLKPNMGFPNPPVMASTTNPDVIRVTAELCLQAGAKKILILDHPLRRPEVCLKRNGILDAVKKLDDTHVFAVTDRQFFKHIEVPGGKELRHVEVLKDVLDADALINIPIAKSHNATGVSLGIKGLMGVIYDREYFHEKVDLNQAIADLSTVVKPKLTIIDATRVMTAGGPTGPGPVEELKTIVAGADPVAADAAVVPLTKWYGHEFSAENVKHIRKAYDLGLGEINLDKLKIRRITLNARNKS